MRLIHTPNETRETQTGVSSRGNEITSKLRKFGCLCIARALGPIESSKTRGG